MNYEREKDYCLFIYTQGITLVAGKFAFVIFLCAIDAISKK